VEKGSFRRDLYYRLNVVTCVCRPCARGKRTLKGLVDHFLAHYGNRHLITHECLTPCWPTSGRNVRELENCIQRMVPSTPARCCTPRICPPRFRTTWRRANPRDCRRRLWRSRCHDRRLRPDAAVLSDGDGARSDRPRPGVHQGRQIMAAQLLGIGRRLFTANSRNTGLRAEGSRQGRIRTREGFRVRPALVLDGDLESSEELLSCEVHLIRAPRISIPDTCVAGSPSCSSSASSPSHLLKPIVASRTRKTS